MYSHTHMHTQSLMSSTFKQLTQEFPKTQKLHPCDTVDLMLKSNKLR